MSVLLLSLLACSPSEPDVGISPRPASSSDDLVVTPDPPIGETWVYRWARDGEVQRDLVSNRVPADRTRRGQRWKVSVERRIGRRTSGAGEASTVVQNGPPEVVAAIVEGREGLQAVTWPSDPDGDPVTVAWVWELDGELVQEGGVLATAALARDQEWTLRAWGDDGDARGDDATATFTVGNQPPVLRSASITPEQPSIADALDVVLEADDPDGDPLTVDVEWRADGAPLATGTPLPAGVAPRGPWIDAVVTVTDGTTRSASVVAPGLRLVNGIPSITTASVEPPELAFGVGPTCVVDGWFDADGDPETIEVRWFIDSVLWTGVGSPSGTSLVKGQQVQCEATPVDDVEAGTPRLSQPAPVVNSPPSIARVFIEPEAPTASDPIQLNFETIYDPDGDAVFIEVGWFVDGNLVATTSIGDEPGGGDTFPETVARGQQLAVECTPFDGEDFGIPVVDGVVIANAVPTVSALAVTPNPPQAGVDLVPMVATEDADGDPVSVSFEWSIDGGPPVSSPVLPGAELQSGQTITLLATPYDGIDTGEVTTLDNLVVP